MTLWILIVAALVAAGAFWWPRRGTSIPQEQAQETWLPRALAGATLAYAEQTFRSHRLRIVARLDRAYRAAGVLTLVEYKTREITQVYESDIIELSAQRVALAEATGDPVADVAYVLIEMPSTGRRTVHPVLLLPAEHVAELAVRYRSIQQGAQVGQPARAAGLCRKCSHLSECRSRFGDR